VDCRSSCLHLHTVYISINSVKALNEKQKGVTKTVSLTDTSISLRFNGIFPGGPTLAGTRMSPFWILLELRVEVVVITGAIRCATDSIRHAYRQKGEHGHINTQRNEKKRSERRKHCALAVVTRSQKNRPAADPLPGGSGWPKFNQLEMVTTFTYRPSLVRIDSCNFELSWYQTHKRTPPSRWKHTNRTDNNTLRR